MRQTNEDFGRIDVTSAIVSTRPEPLEVSSGVSNEARAIADLIRKLSDRDPSCFSDTEQLPAAAFELKSRFGQFSMHLSPSWRESVFKQLDQILDKDSWDFDDIIPEESSWTTLIRLLIWCRFKRLPGLGIFNGHPMLTWVNDTIRINITCYPDDLVRWVASRRIGDRLESSIGDTTPNRMSDVLYAYNDGSWLLDGR